MIHRKTLTELPDCTIHLDGESGRFAGDTTFQTRAESLNLCMGSGGLGPNVDSEGALLYGFSSICDIEDVTSGLCGAVIDGECSISIICNEGRFV